MDTKPTPRPRWRRVLTELAYMLLVLALTYAAFAVYALATFQWPIDK